MIRERFISLAALIFFSCFSLTAAHAIEPKLSSAKFVTAKAAFMRLSVTLEEGNIPYSDTKWRIVRADDSLNAFSSEDIILQGTTDSKGKSAITIAQRKKVFSAWEATPNNIWFVYGLRAFRFSVKPENGSYQIKMLWRVEDDASAVKNRDNPEESKKLSSSIYTQPGFKSEEFAKDFSDWKKIFLSDLKSFQLEIKKDFDYGKKLLEPENEKALANAFINSIDTGEKGLSLRKMIISAAYSGDRRVWSPGTAFTQLISSEQAKPVGYGGKFNDLNRSVELWYMVFEDLSSWTQRDFNESIIFSAFKPLELPANGITKRNSWPAFVFVRDEHHKLKMYGLSAEMSSIINAVFNAQIR